MGTTVPFKCPVEGCEYRGMFRISPGEPNYGWPDNDSPQDALRKEHPGHRQVEGNK